MKAHSTLILHAMSRFKKTRTIFSLLIARCACRRATRPLRNQRSTSSSTKWTNCSRSRSSKYAFAAQFDFLIANLANGNMQQFEKKKLEELVRQRKWQQRYKFMVAAGRPPAPGAAGAIVGRASTSKNSSNNEAANGESKPEWLQVTERQFPIVRAQSQIKSRISNPFDIVQLNEAAKAARPGAEVRRRLDIDAQSTDSDYALGMSSAFYYKLPNV